MSKVKSQMDLCYDHRAPSIVVEIQQYRQGYIDIRKRGGTIRVITEITKDNLAYCEELSKYVDELRHLDGITGGLAVSDTEFMATTTLYEAEPLTQAIYSSIRELVEQQHYVFEALWNKAIPAKDRIREIEEGIKPDTIEVLRNTPMIQKLYLDLIRSATCEILLIFPTSNAFNRQARIGILKSLKEAATSRGIKIRILTPAPVDEVIEKVAYSLSDRISIRQIESATDTKSTIIVVDRQQSLAMEIKDDSELYFSDGIGLSIYSNSNATIQSYISMFESFWIQSESFRKLKAVEEMQRELINAVAYELRAPIQPILGVAEVIDNAYGRASADSIATTGILPPSAPAYEEVSSLLSIVVRNAKRLQHVTEQVLDVARIESGSLTLNKESFNLADIVGDVIEEFKSKAASHDVKLLLQHNPNDAVAVVVNADRNRILQALRTLIDNAIQVSQKGTMVRVLIRLAIMGKEGKPEKEGYLIIGIRDTRNQQIDPAVISELFAKFSGNLYSEAVSRLELFISKSIIEAHGGKVWAGNNKDGKGVTFWLTLPLSSSISNQMNRVACS